MPSIENSPTTSVVEAEVELRDILRAYFNDVTEGAIRQLHYSMEHNVPASREKLSDVVDHAFRSGIVSSFNSRNDHALDAAARLAAEIMEDVNDHEYAAMLYSHFRSL